MSQILTDIVRHPSAWYGRDLANDSSWIVHLQKPHLEEIAAAAAMAKARGVAFSALARTTSRSRPWRRYCVAGRKTSIPAGASICCAASTCRITPTKRSA